MIDVHSICAFADNYPIKSPDTYMIKKNTKKGKKEKGKRDSYHRGLSWENFIESIPSLKGRVQSKRAIGSMEDIEIGRKPEWISYKEAGIKYHEHLHCGGEGKQRRSAARHRLAFS